MSELEPGTPQERPLPPERYPPSAVQTVVNRIELPTHTILRVILVVAALWLLRRLWPVLLLVLIASFLAIALNPAVTGLQRRRLSRGPAILVVLVVFVAALAGLGLLLIPPLVEQGQSLAENLPDYVERAQRTVNENPTVRDWLQRNAQQGQANPTSLVGGAFAVGASIAAGIVSVISVIVMTLYLLLDGPRVYRWCLDLLPARYQSRVDRLRPEVTRVISGYMLGQAITSFLFGLFTFVVLTVAGVPEPLLLAVIAALLDAVPLVGAFLATVPAVLLALTVSWPTGLIVLALYLGYQQLENYVIAPRIYGTTLQISSLATVIAILCGATLLGIVGVLLALPIAAVLPAILRIWREDPASEPASD